MIEDALEDGWNRGKKEGKEEGRIEGIKEGIKENKLSVAKKLSEEGISLEIIKKVTNLSDDDIKALK